LQIDRLNLRKTRELSLEVDKESKGLGRQKDAKDLSSWSSTLWWGFESNDGNVKL
jgi:hypothetical protein